MKEEFKDLIGRDVVVNKICHLINYMKEDETFCLALNGDWGSGKSSVLKLLHQKLSSNEEYILIKYDAWKNSFYSDPLIAILYSILDSIKEYFVYADTFEKQLKRCGRVFTKTLKEFMDKCKKYSDMKTRLACYFIQKIAEVIKAVNNNILDDKNFEEFKSYQRLLVQAQELLNEVVSFPLYKGKQTKLIIMVDEIDRCLPSEQLRILERLHHLFEVNNCAVIVSLNQTAIEDTFNKSFGGDGKEYLRKFFKYTFNIQIQWKTLLRNSLLDAVNEFNNLLNENNLLQEEDVFFVCQYIENIHSRIASYSSIKKMENRLIARFISDIKKVLDTISIDKLNYIYFYFVVIMLFYRMFSSSEFEKCFLGEHNSDYYEDSFARFQTPPQIEASFRYYTRNGSHNFDLYLNAKANEYNYLHNKCLFKNTERDVEVDKFFNTTLSVQPKWEWDIVKNLLQEINNYSLGN